MTIKDNAIALALSTPESIDAHRARLTKRTVVTDEGCHEFMGRREHGYGYIGIRMPGATIAVRAHRLAYALANGLHALPAGFHTTTTDSPVIDHTCGNRACVNPAHLEVVTQAVNLARRTRQEVAA